MSNVSAFARNPYVVLAVWDKQRFLGYGTSSQCHNSIHFIQRPKSNYPHNFELLRDINVV